jgi:hypothetical protein
MSLLGKGIPDGPQIRIIPLAGPLKSEDQFGKWMHDEYTAEDIIGMIEQLKPQVLERYFTGAQNPLANVPVKEGAAPMTVQEFLDASIDAGAPGCIIIPKLNLTWISWGKEKYFWKAAENNYKLPLKRPIRIINLDNWKLFLEKHGQEKAKTLLNRLREIGYEQIGVNMAGGYRDGFGFFSFADFLIDSKKWEIRTSTLEKLKNDPFIDQYFLYIDYPGQMKELMGLPVDKQAGVFTKLIRNAQREMGFRFVYPVLFDDWDSNKQFTSSTGEYKGVSMFEVIKGEINPDGM